MARSGAHSLAPAERASVIDDAVAVGRSLGLAIGDPVVLSDNLNLIVHLRPSPIVARVAVRTSLVRHVDALSGSLGLAAHLAAAGLPVAPPADSIDPGPHIGPRTGRPMTLWRYLDALDPERQADPAWAGSTLRAIHTAARDYRGPLGHVGPLAEIARLAGVIATDRPGDAAWIRTVLGRIEVPARPVQPVHGDAHLGNVLVARDGPVWIDWEESWRGPVAWDLACLDHRRRVFDELVDEIEGAFAAYGRIDAADTAAVEAWAPVVSLWALAWGTRGAIELGEDVSDRAKARRRDLARRFGMRDRG